VFATLPCDALARNTSDKICFFEIGAGQAGEQPGAGKPNGRPHKDGDGTKTQPDSLTLFEFPGLLPGKPPRR
jgi:hypothetical protein